MLKTTIKFFVVLALVVAFAESGFAQTSEEWQAIFARARETAVFENGKIRSVSFTIPGGPAKTFNFEHSQDGNSVTIVDEENYEVEVFFDQQKRISRIMLPENGEAEFIWSANSSRGSVIEDIIFKENGVQFSTLVPGPDTAYGACRDANLAAGAATVIALGVCAADPGSSDCWSATASAAAAVALAYRICRRRD